MRAKLLLTTLFLMGAACQALAPAAEPTTTEGETEPVRKTPTPRTQTAAVPAPRALAALTVDASAPFSDLSLVHARENPYAGVDYTLPLDLEGLANAQVIAGLTEAQRAFLQRNGFAVIHSQEEQFYAIREGVSRVQGQPYFLTLDAGLHALHLTFDDLLKSLERERLRPQMASIVQATLDEVLTYLPSLQGTAIQGDAELAAAYLSVASQLFEPDSSVDPTVADSVARQVAQIMEAGGRAPSTLIPDFEDDYGAYKPVGHYAGDEDLERYFRGMTWLGRVHFDLKDESSSRLPLIVTLALRRAQVGGEPAAQGWISIHETLTFLIGPSDDGGPAEYADLMDEVYGASPSPLDLADDDLWRAFVARRERIPAPQINSTFVGFLSELESQAGWRFMGQRFTLDAFIFQNLVFDKVLPRGDQRRLLPTGPDIMAALGSETAMRTLQELGETTYPNYPEQMTSLQETVRSRSEAQWLGRAYEAWLYAFLPILEDKGQAFPSFMRGDSWGLKEMNAALGSWAELKHDTILYTKMPEGAGGGGPPCSSGPAPGFVEPNPEAFTRMAYLARTIASGLRQRDMALPPELGPFWDLTTLDGLVQGMETLGEQFEALSGIAEKELAGSPLGQDDYRIIQACLGTTECTLGVAGHLAREVDDDVPPPPIVAAVAGAGAADAVLEVGTGYIDRIYVVVPIEGRMQVAQGGVYAYYEFTQPRAERLTDEEWRERLKSAQPPPLPPWASDLVLPGGSSTEAMGFHLGSAYTITEEGSDLNLRDQPGLGGRILERLETGDMVQLIGGPVEADGYTWWQFNNCFTDETGWAVEEPAWYERYWD